MKQVRSLFSAAALSLSLLALPASGRTTLYVSPADASLASPISVTAAEAHQVLSHHLDVATSAVVDADADADADAGARIWAHLGSSSSQQPELELELEHEDGHGRARVERLFDGGDDKNRLLVLVHGASDRTGELSCLPALVTSSLTNALSDSLQTLCQTVCAPPTRLAARRRTRSMRCSTRT